MAFTNCIDLEPMNCGFFSTSFYFGHVAMEKMPYYVERYYISNVIGLPFPRNSDTSITWGNIGNYSTSGTSGTSGTGGTTIVNLTGGSFTWIG